MLRHIVFSLLLGVAASAAAIEPVALVTELKGSGTMGAQGRPTALELLQDMVPGTRVTLARAARAVVVHTASGTVYELLGPGSFRVQAKSVEAVEPSARISRRELPAEIRSYRLNPSVAAQASTIMRSGVGGLRLDGPDGGVLDEDELRYAVSGTLQETQVDVLDEQGSNVVHLEGADSAAFELKGLFAWLPGERYTVNVSGKDARGRAVALKARFQLLPSDAAAQLRARQPTAATPATDWIVYALALESVGANATARSIWRTRAAAR
jgi:hypothetical protein